MSKNSHGPQTALDKILQGLTSKENIAPAESDLRMYDGVAFE